MGPPFFLRRQCYPPGGLWGDRCWLLVLASWETQQTQGIAGHPCVDANHSYLDSIGQGCFSPSEGRITFGFSLSWSHVAAQALTACQPLQLLYSLLCDQTQARGILVFFFVRAAHTTGCHSLTLETFNFFKLSTGTAYIWHLFIVVHFRVYLSLLVHRCITMVHVFCDM